MIGRNIGFNPDNRDPRYVFDLTPAVLIAFKQRALWKVGCTGDDRDLMTGFYPINGALITRVAAALVSGGKFSVRKRIFMTLPNCPS